MAVRDLQNTIFMLQRLLLRHEDFLAALRPELNFVMFARTDVAAAVVPAIYQAQKAWREDKAPEAGDTGSSYAVVHEYIMRQYGLES